MLKSYVQKYEYNPDFCHIGGIFFSISLLARWENDILLLFAYFFAKKFRRFEKNHYICSVVG